MCSVHCRRIFTERYGMNRAVRPSVVCLPATLLHPTQRIELFGNIFAPTNSLETRTVCRKILNKIQRAVGDPLSQMEET